MKDGMIGARGRVLAVREKKEPAYRLAPTEEERCRIAEQQDRHSLLKGMGEAVVDRDERMLAPPVNVRKVLSDRLIISKSAPEVEFAVIPYGFRYFPSLEPDFDTSSYIPKGGFQ
jgi:hypothetical protein